MRAIILPVAAWAGVLQTVHAPPAVVGDPAYLIGLATVLGSATVLVYRLGVWRQEMENTRNNVGAELKGYREETSANFERMGRRLESIDHLIAELSQLRLRMTRWQARNEKRLERLEEEAAQ
jgi:hypothetical protein